MPYPHPLDVSIPKCFTLSMTKIWDNILKSVVSAENVVLL